MIKRVISVITAITILLFPTAAFTQQGRIAPIKKGQAAPFNGLVYDYKADAVMSARREASEARHKIDKEHALALKDAKHKAQLQSVVASKEAAQKRYNEIGKIKDNRMTSLEKQVLDHKDYSMWWFSGGVIGGILITLASAWALGQATQVDRSN